jgi:hypothetical protein
MERGRLKIHCMGFYIVQRGSNIRDKEIIAVGLADTRALYFLIKSMWVE